MVSYGKEQLARQRILKMTDDMIDYTCYQYNKPDELADVKSIFICMGLYANEYKGPLYDRLTTLKGLKEQIIQSNTIEYLKEIRISNCQVWEIVTKDLNDNEIEYIKGL